MTQEEKDLVLRDLCSRLPYGVKLLVEGWDSDRGCEFNTVETLIGIDDRFIHTIWDKTGDKDKHSIVEPLSILDYKPYLRPMSSMTEEEAKELLFVRLASRYGESCVYIKNFIKLIEVSFQKKSPYKGSIAVWFSFKNKILDGSQIREYSKCEYFGQINNITLAEIDWFNKKMYDYLGLIEKDAAIAVTKDNNCYKY